jgi:hypothetical protein
MFKKGEKPRLVILDVAFENFQLMEIQALEKEGWGKFKQLGVKLDNRVVYVNSNGHTKEGDLVKIKACLKDGYVKVELV